MSSAAPDTGSPDYTETLRAPPAPSCEALAAFAERIERCESDDERDNLP